MAKEKILMTGATGLVGSKFVAMYSDKYDVIDLGRDEKGQRVDITDLTALETAVQKHPEAKTILHLAAYTDVNGAFEQTGDKNGIAYQVNVLGTENIVEMARSYEKHLIHISTAFVFDGEKTEGEYVETDTPHAIEWYGQTKLWAEEKILAATAEGWYNWTILRIDQPFRNDEFPKKDSVHKIISGLKEGNLYPQFTDHYFGPTYINDLAKILDFVMREKEKVEGEIYHASSGEKWSDYEFAQMINEELKLGGKVEKGDLSAYLATLARPYQLNTALNCDKLKAILDFELLSMREAVSKVEV